MRKAKIRLKQNTDKSRSMPFKGQLQFKRGKPINGRQKKRKGMEEM